MTISLNGNGLDLDQGVLRKAGDLTADSGWLVLGEELGVDFIHSVEVADVLKADSGLGNLVVVGAAGLQNVAEVDERLLSLLLDGRWKLSVFHAELARDEQEAVRLHGVGVWAEAWAVLYDDCFKRHSGLVGVGRCFCAHTYTKYSLRKRVVFELKHAVLQRLALRYVVAVVELVVEVVRHFPAGNIVYLTDLIHGLHGEKVVVVDELLVLKLLQVEERQRVDYVAYVRSGSPVLQVLHPLNERVVIFVLIN